jgi:hypothetical protein
LLLNVLSCGGVYLALLLGNSLPPVLLALP